VQESKIEPSQDSYLAAMLAGAFS